MLSRRRFIPQFGKAHRLPENTPAKLLKQRKATLRWPSQDLVGEACSALRPAARQNLAAVSIGHSFPETMLLLSVELLGLVSSQHEKPSFRVQTFAVYHYSVNTRRLSTVFSEKKRHFWGLFRIFSSKNNTTVPSMLSTDPNLFFHRKKIYSVQNRNLICIILQNYKKRNEDPPAFVAVLLAFFELLFHLVSPQIFFPSPQMISLSIFPQVFQK